MQDVALGGGVCVYHTFPIGIHISIKRDATSGVGGIDTIPSLWTFVNLGSATLDLAVRLARTRTTHEKCQHLREDKNKHTPNCQDAYTHVTRTGFLLMYCRNHQVIYGRNQQACWCWWLVQVWLVQVRFYTHKKRGVTQQ